MTETRLRIKIMFNDGTKSIYDDSKNFEINDRFLIIENAERLQKDYIKLEYVFSFSAEEYRV